MEERFADLGQGGGPVVAPLRRADGRGRSGPGPCLPHLCRPPQAVEDIADHQPERPLLRRRLPDQFQGRMRVVQRQADRMPGSQGQVIDAEVDQLAPDIQQRGAAKVSRLDQLDLREGQEGVDGGDAAETVGGADRQVQDPQRMTE